MRAETSGSCYGFDISSELPLSYLRASNGTGTPLAIRTGPVPENEGLLLKEWNKERAEIMATRLFEPGRGRYIVRVGDEDSFEVHTEPPAIIVHPGSMNGEDRETMIWGMPMGVSMAHQGRLPFHAGSVDVGGRGVILAATGSFGKTTLAGAFHASGHRLLADDMSCAIADPLPALLPGPAVIRARPDVAAGFTFSNATADFTTPAKTHFVLNAATRGTGDPVPLRAIVFLRISDGPINLERYPGPDALRDLFGLSFRLPTEEGRIRAFELAAQLTRTIPAWNLWRPLTLRSLPAVIEAIIERCLD